MCKGFLSLAEDDDVDSLVEQEVGGPLDVRSARGHQQARHLAFGLRGDFEELRDVPGVAADPEYRRLKVSGAEVSGNGTAGIFVTNGRARLESSVVSGHAVDVASAKPQKLKATTCATSRKIVDGQITAESWLVCPGE